MGDWLKLCDAWQAAQKHGERILLFTIVDIDGSSYRKLGARMLLTDAGLKAGSISAGCIEADILTRARDFFEGELPTTISYDNRGEDLFALNVGCSGSICIRIEEITNSKNNALANFQRAGDSRKPVAMQTTIDEQRTYKEIIQPPLRAIVFGAGADALPVVRLAREADFDTLLIDWRNELSQQASAESFSFRGGRGDALAEIEFDDRTCVVIMSHHFDEDKAALKAALRSSVPYIGMMGPRKRTDRMLNELGLSADERLHYPVGLDIGADTPSQIAISIVGELMTFFSRTSARKLQSKDAAIHAAVR